MTIYSFGTDTCLIITTAEAENRPKSAHRYNVAEQQQIYRSEIERIWKAQFDSLSRKDEPELSEEEEEVVNDPKKRRQSVASIMSPMIHTPGPASPAFSRASSVTRERESSLGPDQRKVLRIKRLVHGEWKIEIIRDVAVINAYVKKRQAMEEEATTADALAPTGDAEKDKRAKKRCVYLLSVLLVCTQLFRLQTGRGNCSYEEEPGTTAAQKERQDCQGGWCSHAAEPPHEARYHGTRAKLPVL